MENSLKLGVSERRSKRSRTWVVKQEQKEVSVVVDGGDAQLLHSAHGNKRKYELLVDTKRTTPAKPIIHHHPLSSYRG